MNGGGGDDVAKGGRGNDWLFGDAGRDKLYGEAGNDHLFGGADADWLDGGQGDDYLNGGQGDDCLAGGKGSDTFAFHWTAGAGETVFFRDGHHPAIVGDPPQAVAANVQAWLVYTSQAQDAGFTADPSTAFSYGGYTFYTSYQKGGAAAFINDAGVDTIKDFANNPLSGELDSIRITGLTAEQFADWIAHVSAASDGAGGTRGLFDGDGAGGADPYAVMTLAGVDPGTFTTAWFHI